MPFAHKYFVLLTVGQKFGQSEACNIGYWNQQKAKSRKKQEIYNRYVSQKRFPNLSLFVTRICGWGIRQFCELQEAGGNSNEPTLPIGARLLSHAKRKIGAHHCRISDACI